MGSVSQLVFLDAAIQSPQEAVDQLALATSDAFAVEVGALDVALERADLDETEAVEDLRNLIGTYLQLKSGGELVRAYRARQRLLATLPQLGRRTWAKGRAVFHPPTGQVSLFHPASDLRSQVLATLRQGGNQSTEWEERGFQFLEAQQYLDAAKAFWLAAVLVEQDGKEEAAAKFYTYAAAAWGHAGLPVEAYVFYAIARFYAQLAEETHLENQIGVEMIRAVEVMQDAPQRAAPDGIYPIFLALGDGLGFALKNDFRRAKGSLTFVLHWLAKHRYPFLAANLHKLLGDIFVRGDHHFDAMMTYARAAEGLKKTAPGASLPILQGRYAAAFSMQLGGVFSQADLIDRLIAVYDRQIRQHRSLNEKGLEAQALEEQIKNLVERNRNAAAIAATSRLAKLSLDLKRPAFAAKFFLLKAELLGSENRDQEDVLDAFDKAAGLFEREGHLGDAAAVLEKKAQYLLEKGNPRGAAISYKRLAVCYEALDDGGKQLEALSHTVLALEKAGDYFLSLQTLDILLSLADSKKEMGRKAGAYLFQGKIYARLEQYSQAARALSQAYRIYLKEVEDGAQMATLCLALCSYYLNKAGDRHRAKIAWMGSLHHAYHEEGEQRATEAYVHALLADYFNGLDAYGEALPHYRAATTLFQRRRDVRSAGAWEGFARVQAGLHRWKEAAQAYATARRQFRQMGDDEGVARVQEALKHLVNIN